MSNENHAKAIESKNFLGSVLDEDLGLQLYFKHKDKLKAKMDKLKGLSHDEALALEKERDELLQKLETAIKELEDFEKEKLDMHK